ncbi:hypothetical protein [Arcobacter sp.]|uniref:hypothetical protein n=1 Tax=Arcobacter sp. TaxID=1872629 RepID=UPI003D144AF1
MYLWKVDSLVNDFRENNVSQKEEFKYMLVLTILMIIATDPILYIDITHNTYDVLMSFLILGISIIGLYYSYKINSSGDNKNFIVRVMCLGLPILIRTITIFIPIFIIGIIVEEMFIVTPIELEKETVETTLLHVVLNSLFIVTYYWYLYKKVQTVSKLDT